MSDIELRARQPAWSDMIEMMISSRDRSGHIFVAAPLVLEKIDPGSVHQPQLSVSREAAQKLVNELWECGIRATQSKGSVGQLQATEKHLEDMRELALSRGERLRIASAKLPELFPQGSYKTDPNP